MYLINAGLKKTELCILSYNSRGFGKLKQEYCRQLSSYAVVGNKIPILCNQEHFILRSNSYKISQALPNSHIIVKPAVKECHTKGRARGGLFIAIPDYFKNSIHDVSPSFWRLQAVLVKTQGSIILLINSYFPVDPRTMNIDENELSEVFQNIRNVINENNFSSFLLCGDINCNFMRNTGHVRCVSNFVDEYSWDSFQVDFTHCHELENVTHVSTIDHFFWNEELSSQVLDAGVIHSHENNSDHSPIYCVVKVEPDQVDTNSGQPAVKKPIWSRASQVEKDNFKTSLGDKLEHLIIPESVTSCRNVHCRDTNHQNEVDSFIAEVLGCVEEEAFLSLPVSKPNSGQQKQPKVGWSTQVKPYRDTAHFWSQVWKSAGRPVNTVLHSIMKRSRNIYHYQYRKCERSEETIKKNKILDACINGDGDLFREIKSLRNSGQVVSSSMDGVQKDIQGHFKNIYGRLYNTHDDLEKMAEVEESVQSEVNQSHVNDVKKVTPEIVKEAAKHLNNNKSDPTYSYSSDCIKNGPEILYQHLSAALQSFLIHGHVTLFLLLATLVPIIKDKLGSINSSKNYRSIAMSSLILKLLDWVILLLFGDSLGVDQLQFAYQPGASTTMCTWTAVETISYFLRNGSEVFTCLMDMTKAFDLVRHSIMFKKIIAAGLSLIFVRLLIFIYVNQMANVRWNGSFSDVFSMRNGVRQGAVLSAIFYCIYMNDLFQILRRSKLGCWVNGDFFGILGYSDDNFLLAPSLYGLQEMINICENYAMSHDLQFSTDPDPRKCKTKCLAFLKRKRELPHIQLCGTNLPWVSSGKHLGNNLENKMDGMKHDVLVKRAQYITKNNDLCQEFHFCHPATKFQLNEIYNSSFCGSPLWNLFSRESKMLENTWNTSFRIMYGLPYATHRYFVQSVSNKVHLKNILLKRFLGFLSQIENSPKRLPLRLLNVIKYDTRSTTGSNLRNIMLLLGKVNIDDIKIRDIDNFEYAAVLPDDKWKVDMVKEIIEIGADQLNVENFSEEELEEILEYLCTS